MEFLAVLLTIVCVVGGATAITPPDTSLDTIPVGYKGGVNCTARSQEDIDMLAKMRVIIIEKREGPCCNDCFANRTKTPPTPCQPSCGEENYQMETIERAKAANPKLATVFYFNTLYNFPCYQVHDKFVEANAEATDINGKLVAFKSDAGVPDVNIFDHGQKVARDLWTGFVKNLTDSGYVDGVFGDKRSVMATWNDTGSFWQICEYLNVTEAWNLSCAILSNETALKYNEGKHLVLDALYNIVGDTGVIINNTTDWIQLKNVKSPLNLVERVKDALETFPYCYVTSGNERIANCSNVTTQSKCTDNEIAMFLLAVEKGAVLGCDGWDDQFSKPLGEPLGPAVQNGDILERHFKSGTSVSWDLNTHTGTIKWAEN